jgi:hypothetical protein
MGKYQSGKNSIFQKFFGSKIGYNLIKNLDELSRNNFALLGEMVNLQKVNLPKIQPKSK